MADNQTGGPKTAIVGAGPAGLTLARILLQNNVTDITILERDRSRNARAQGGSLDLHPATGQAALKEAGLFDEFQERSRYEDEGLTIVDNTNRACISVPGKERGRPEIDRDVLRDMLLDSIPAPLIRWGAKVERVEVGEIYLATGEQLKGFDLIVGADGAWSKVRPLLTSVQPFYSGISCHELRYHAIDQKHPELSQMLGRGSYFALGDGHCLLIQRQGTADVRTLAATHKPENWASAKRSVGDHAAAQVKALLRDEYADFAPELRDTIALADDDDLAYWPMYMLPVGLRWRHRAGATLLGDAAHLMTPFAGEGVNNAMADALALARLVVAARGAAAADLDAAVLAYENEMFERVEPSAARTWRNLQDRFFTPDPAQRMAKMVRARMEKRKAELAAAAAAAKGGEV